MADDHPFLFPIVIDDTSDTEARVPDCFRERQWMRLEKSSPEAIASRIAAVLNGAPIPSPVPINRFQPDKIAGKPATKKRLIIGVTAAILIAIGALFWQADRSDSPPNESNASPISAVSEVDELLVKVRQKLRDPNVGRPELEEAEQLINQAVELDDSNAEVWAAAASVDIHYIAFRFDSSPAQVAEARDHITRALQLDPDSYEARLAQVLYWAKGMDGLAKNCQRRRDVEISAQALLEENPGDSRALDVLALTLSFETASLPEALRLWERSTANSHFAPKALTNICYANILRGDYAQADHFLRRSVAIADTQDARVAEVLMNLHWWGDLDAAKAVLDRLEVQFESTQNEKLRWVTLATLRHGYFYDHIRDHPRFQALLARAEASPEHTPNPKTAVEPVDNSIAVLPFANLSEDSDNAFFADGVHEDLITTIAKVRDFHVIARGSTLRFRKSTQSLRSIGKTLGVSHIIQGSVRRAGSRVRISVQLINVATDRNLWTDTFDRDLDGIFALQSEIAQLIAQNLRIVISAGERTDLDAAPTQNLEAWQYFLKFRDLVSRTNDEQAGKINLLEKAVELDPTFATAWARIVPNYLGLYQRSGESDQSLYDKAIYALEQAKKLKPDSAEVYLAESMFTSDLDTKIDVLTKVVALDPGSVGAHRWLSRRYLEKGDYAKALTHIQDALRFDPLSEMFNYDLLQIYLETEQWSHARAVGEKVLGYTSRSSILGIRPGRVNPAAKTVRMSFKIIMKNRFTSLGCV